MKLRYLYLVFCLLGLLLPYSQFVPWIMEHHALNMSIFIRDLFASRIRAFFAFDVIVSAIVLISFIQTEGRRLGMRPFVAADCRCLIGRRFAWIPAFSLFSTTPARSRYLSYPPCPVDNRSTYDHESMAIRINYMKIDPLIAFRRTKSLPLLAVVTLVACVLSSCGTTSSLKGTRDEAITSTRKFSRVTVQDFRLSIPNVGEKVNASKVYFADQIATAIRKTGRFTSVGRNSKADANTLVIDGVITKYEEGNPTLRLFIGMGAGSSFFESDVNFHDGEGTPVGKIKVDKNSWALGGGIAAGQNPQAFMDGAADKIAEEAAKLAK